MVSRHVSGLVLGIIVMVGLLGSGRAEAAYWDVTQLTHNSTDDCYPNVSGGNVTWAGYDGNDWEIFFRGSSGATTQLTDNNCDDGMYRPPMCWLDRVGAEISGSNVAWIGGWDGHHPWIAGPDAVEGPWVRLFDGTSTTTLSQGRQVRVDGSNVVWSMSRGGEIYLYDGSIPQSPIGHGWRPRICGSNVLWERDDLYLYNGTETLQLTDNQPGQEMAFLSLEVSESGAVWNYLGDVFAYDIDKGTTTQLTYDRRAHVWCSISGSKVVCSASDGHDHEVFLYDMETEITTQLSDDEDLDGGPWIDGSNVVYFRRLARGQGDPWTVCLMAHDVGTGVTAELIRETHADSGEYLAHRLRDPQISGSEIVWAGYDGNDYEIFMATYIPDPTMVSIDIKPSSEPNSINLASKGIVPVAILGSETFDVHDVDQASLELAGAEPKQKGNSGKIGSFEDVNGDLILDLVLHFPTPDLELDPQATEALLAGLLNDGSAIAGSDAVRVVACAAMGDCNLDGLINIGDLSVLGCNYGLDGLSWTEGDFNGDAVVDIGDLGILGSNYGLGGGAAVPEPASAILLLIGGVLVMRRCRKDFHGK